MKDSQVGIKTKYKSLLKDTLIFSLGKFGSRLVLFFLVPLYTNCLSKEEYGTADLIFTISQLLVPVFSVVIYDGVVRYGLMKGVKKENVLLCAIVVLGFCSAITAIATPLFSLYRDISSWKYYLSALIILMATMDIEMNYLKVNNKNLLYSIISIIQSVILAGSNILLLVFIPSGVDGYLLSTILSYLSCVVLAFFAGHIYRDLSKAEFDKELLKQMLIFSSPLILNSVSWWVIQSSDKFMLETMVGAAALGLYTAASKIPSLINVVVTVFQQAWGISSIKEIESSNNVVFYSNVFKVFSSCVFFCCMVLNTIVKPFMSIYVGAEFSDSWQFVPLLVASAGFAAISTYYGSLYSALKKSVNNMFTTVISAVVNIIVNLIFISLCGIWGAIIGTIVSYVLIAYLRMFDVSRYLKFDNDLIRFVANSAIVLLQAVIVSLNMFPYYGSLLFIALFLAINRRSLINLFRHSSKKGE